MLNCINVSMMVAVGYFVVAFTSDLLASFYVPVGKPCNESVRIGDILSSQVVIQNDTNQPFRIVKIITTCGCLTPSQFVAVNILPSRRFESVFSYQPKSVGRQEGAVMHIVSEVEQTPGAIADSFVLETTFSANVLPELKATPATIFVDATNRSAVSVLTSLHGDSYAVQAVMTSHACISADMIGPITPRGAYLTVTVDESVDELPQDGLCSVVLNIASSRIDQFVIPVTVSKGNVSNAD